MATMPKTITVNLHVQINDQGVALWRVRLLGFVARLLGVSLSVKEPCDYWRPIREGSIALPCSCGRDCDGLER